MAAYRRLFKFFMFLFIVIMFTGCEWNDEVDSESNTVKYINFYSITNKVIFFKGKGTDKLPECTELSFQALDQNNNAVKGLKISYELSTEGKLSNAVLSAQYSITDKNGIAKVLVHSGGVAGEFTVKAKHGDITSSSELIKIRDTVDEIKFLSTTSAIIAVKNSSSDNVPEFSKISFQVLDANGDISKNTKVDFTLSSSGLLNGVTLSTNEAFSDEKGLVEVIAYSGANTGSFTLKASYNNFSVSVVSDAITISSNVGSISFLSADYSKIAIKGSGTEQLPETAKISFQVRDSKGSPVKNAKIGFSLSSDSILKEIQLLTTTAISDEKGVVTAIVKSGSIIGAYTVKAVYNDINSVSDNLYVVQNVKNITYESSVSKYIMVKGSATSLTQDKTSLFFKVTDTDGVAFTNAKVSFSIAYDSDDLGVSLSSTAGISDSNGIVKVDVSSGASPGRFRVKASCDSIVSYSEDINIVKTDIKEIRCLSATPANIALKGLGGGYVPESARIQFIVLDGNGNPARDIKVNFSLSTDGMLNGISLSSLSAITNESGAVEVNAMSSDKICNFTVSASASVIPNVDVKQATSPSISVTSSLAKISFVSASPSQLSYGQSSLVSFSVKDSNGNPLRNMPVSFVLSSEGLLNNVALSNTTQSTNDNGLVQVRVTAGFKTCSFSVTASYLDQQATSSSIQVNSIVESIKYVSASLSSISTGDGSTTLTFEILDQMNEPLPNAQIDFTVSAEGVLNNIKLSSSSVVSNGSGLVQVTAYAGLKECRFTVVASYRASSQEIIRAISDEISVVTNNVSSILFKSITNSTVAVQGNGTDLIPETTKVVFKTLDSSSNPISGVKVKIAVSPDIAATITAENGYTSDSNGDIIVIAKSKTQILDFKVIATLDGDDSISAETTPIAITSNRGKAINFISASPTLIALKGTGGTDLTETSVLTFKSVDERGRPVPGEDINFALSSKVGGVTLSTTLGKTDSNGIVSVNVISGNLPTTITVIASLVSDPNVRVISNQVNISTGRASVGNFSIGPEGFHAIGAWTTNGIEKKVNARAFDRFHHPVPDGTVISFRTEWGGIDSFCQTSAGSCSVTWRSVGDRTLFNSQDPMGRVTVAASVMGEEKFVDINSDGMFDSNDQPFWDPDEGELPELFINSVEIKKVLANSGASSLPDTNVKKWSWVPDTDYVLSTDEFLDDNLNGIWNTGNGKYNGKLCTDAAEASGICSKELVRVWDSSVILATPPDPAASASMALYDAATGNPVSSIDLSSLAIGSSRSYVLEVKDSLGNPLPGATSITFAGINAAGEAVELSTSVTKITIPESASIGFGTTLFNFAVFRTAVQKVQISIKVSGAGEREYKIPVTEPIT